MLSVWSIQIIILIVFLILERNVAFAEFWTRTFGRYYTMIFSNVNQTLGFSLTEVSFYIVLISCIFFLGWGFSLLGYKRKWDFIHRIIMIVLIITGSITMYNLSVGAAYYRKDMPIELYEGEIKKEDFKSIATYFVNDYNNCVQELGIDENGELKLKYSHEHMIEKLRLEFDSLDDSYFHPFVAKPKRLESSGLLTMNGIVGMYFGVLGEVNYNYYSTNAELPYYIAHELCHAKGVMREDDAQLLTLKILANSDDPLFRYSAYWVTLDRVIQLTKLTDNANDYQEVVGLICDEIWANNKYVAAHWKGKAFLADLGDKINDWYLKTFGQKSGTTSYQDTPTVIDNDNNVITLSKYQSLYFKIYYDKNA